MVELKDVTSEPRLWRCHPRRFTQHPGWYGTILVAQLPKPLTITASTGIAAQIRWVGLALTDGDTVLRTSRSPFDTTVLFPTWGQSHEGSQFIILSRGRVWLATDRLGDQALRILAEPETSDHP